ncbi:MAG: hypothetical protein ACI902_002368 [Psychroserpens sp.]
MTFADSFTNEVISVIVHNTQFFLGILSTDSNLGASRVFELSRDSKYITIKINHNKNIKIKNHTDYRFTCTFKNENKIKIK